MSIQDFQADDLDQYCSYDGASAESSINGRPPFTAQLVTLRQTCEVFIVFRFAHAVFDGLSAAILIDDFAALYNGRSLPSTSPFSAHLQAVMTLQNEAAYDCISQKSEGAAGPPHIVKVAKTISAISLPPNITLSTVLKTAWAATLHRYFAPKSGWSSATDVFGQVAHGPNLSVAHADRILGPCINIVPQQLLETKPYAALGYQDIVQNCTPWSATTPLASFVRCQASYYPLPNNPSHSSNVHIYPEGDQLYMDIAVSSQVLDRQQVEFLLEQYCRIISEFGSDGIEEAPELHGLKLQSA
ncbi:uncharacterized protein BO97DRAFT_424313 [Aspergillus homomorphus CBS 101889]|uniref:CoA-dependent acyltransferase n=1 Tax=Aspergillus homomorphus (strain CBS 101889) TaxID=1450537 RepID=A0A395HY05_ASPHC|nr:hypothetical protein BO97DRAFT_424313 [Aspergillus homomorphus CBS 101889]RAL12677.1 hypothetical protein BO97DRAFT_424313 [Aspergillus homomorphus CBS 101889]